MSAVSKKLRPCSRHTSTRRVASLFCVLPQRPKNSLLPPNVPVPNERTGTCRPERPRERCSMASDVEGKGGRGCWTLPANSARHAVEHRDAARASADRWSRGRLGGHASERVFAAVPLDG